MRKLTSVQKIISLDPIEGADKIEVATVLWWKCVVKKWDFSVGDLCTYIEIDSFLPAIEQFSFLGSPKVFDGKLWHRIKTIKLKGQVSQWLVLSYQQTISIKARLDYREWSDITEDLGIIKYDPEALKESVFIPKHKWRRYYYYAILLRVKVKLGIVKYDQKFPSFIPKTDEDRVQVMGKEIERHLGERVYVREKLDGSSITCYLKDGKFWVCSRNLELKNKNNKYRDTVARMGIEDIMRSNFTRDLALQWELIGPWIQGNKYWLNDLTIKRFSLYDIKKGKYMYLGPNTPDLVPNITEEIELHWSIEDRVATATRKSLLNPDVEAEGIVVRTYDKSLSFKVINPRFLLKYDE